VNLYPRRPNAVGRLSESLPPAVKLPCTLCPGREIGICSPLDEAGLAHLLAMGRTVRWKKGETMFRAGDALGMFYKVTKGIVAVHRTLEDGRRQIVAFHTIGDLCGYLENAGTYNFGGDAITDVEACAFDRRKFHAFATQHIGLATALGRDMTDKLKRAAENMAAIGQLNTTERVAYFLLQLGNIYATRLGARPPLHLRLSRQQIAEYLGMKIETVSRSFAKLKTKGLIVLIGLDTVVIQDREKLEEFACLPPV